MESLFIKYGVLAGAADQTATPTTATVTNNWNSITFRITNNDALTASVAWQIRRTSSTGTLINSGTLNLSSGSNSTVSASTSQCTTYVLTNVIATAAGKEPSEKGTDRTLTTPSAPNGTLLSSFCSGGSLVGTYANGSCGTFNQTIDSCSTSCGCDPCAGCSAAGTDAGSYCSGCTRYYLENDGCCGTYVSSTVSNDTTCPGCEPPPPQTCADLAGQDCSFCVGCDAYLASYTGGGTYPNCTCQTYDISFGFCC
jgi:hypothetical protein